MTAIELITGTVAGFALVIDPNNGKGKCEDIKFAEAASMKARISELNRENAAGQNADPRNYDPIETLYFTLYRRDDNGTEEREQGFNFGATNVGDTAHKKFCKCGKSSWWKNRPGWSMNPTFVCEDCNKSDDESIIDPDLTNYDGMQEREY